MEPWLCKFCRHDFGLSTDAMDGLEHLCFVCPKFEGRDLLRSKQAVNHPEHYAAWLQKYTIKAS